MNECQRRRLAGQPVSMSTPPDRRRAVQHYEDMARESEHIRREREAQDEIDRLRGELAAAHRTISELKANR
jgi:hypothetical protein